MQVKIPARHGRNQYSMNHGGTQARRKLGRFFLSVPARLRDDESLAPPNWPVRMGRPHRHGRTAAWSFHCVVAAILGLMIGCWPTRAAAQDELAKSLGEGFSVHRSEHFALVTNTQGAAAQAQLAVLEDTWETFFRETAKIGMATRQPQGRLTCVLFEKRSQFLGYLKGLGEHEAEWSAGTFLAKHEQTVFFHDSDNPAFAEVVGELTRLDGELAGARARLAGLPAQDTAGRIVLQERIRRLAAQRSDLHRRFVAVASASTLGKSRHETAHQLLFTTGVQDSAKPYPWFLTEGLACLFEHADKSGRSGPGLPNQWRLMSYGNAQKADGLVTVGQLVSYAPAEKDNERTVAWRYAQAWGLMHYLWNSRPADLRAMIADINETPEAKNWPAIFEKRLGPDSAELDRRVREHVQGMLAER